MAPVFAAKQLLLYNQTVCWYPLLAANLVKSARISPLKSYSTLVANAQRKAVVQPLALAKIAAVSVWNW